MNRLIFVLQKLQNEVATSKSKVASKPAVNRPSQKALIGGLIKKRKAEETETTAVQGDDVGEPKKAKPITLTKGALQCIGILPGIGKYNDSSDSEASENSGDEDCVKSRGILDIVSRKSCSKKGDE